jgi:hypothetical protein
MMLTDEQLVGLPEVMSVLLGALRGTWNFGEYAPPRHSVVDGKLVFNHEWKIWESYWDTVAEIECVLNKRTDG